MPIKWMYMYNSDCTQLALAAVIVATVERSMWSMCVTWNYSPIYHTEVTAHQSSGSLLWMWRHAQKQSCLQPLMLWHVCSTKTRSNLEGDADSWNVSKRCTRNRLRSQFLVMCLSNWVMQVDYEAPVIISEPHVTWQCKLITLPLLL